MIFNKRFCGVFLVFFKCYRNKNKKIRIADFITDKETEKYVTFITEYRNW